MRILKFYENDLPVINDAGARFIVNLPRPTGTRRTPFNKSNQIWQTFSNDF